jgi:hypothetical protein
MSTIDLFKSRCDDIGQNWHSSRCVLRIDRGRDHRGFLAAEAGLGLEPIDAPSGRGFRREWVAFGNFGERRLDLRLGLLRRSRTTFSTSAMTRMSGMARLLPLRSGVVR